LEEVGKELWKWFNKGYDPIEDIIERTTGVKDPKQK